MTKIKYPITTVNEVKGKFCSQCKVWKPLIQFSKNRKHPTGTKVKCRHCLADAKPFCIFPNCTTKAVHGYENCKKHGGGSKCQFIDEEGTKCKTPRRPPHLYCIRHGGKRYCKVIENNKECGEPIREGFNTCKDHGGYHLCKFMYDEGRQCTKAALNGFGLCSGHLPIQICKNEYCGREYTRFCRNCKIKDVETRLKTNLHLIKDNDKRCKKDSRHVESDLTVDYLLNCFEVQEGKCYYCQLELSADATDKSLNQISIERIHSSVAHLTFNVVITCLMCNYAKNDMAYGKWQTLMHILQGRNAIIDLSHHNLKTSASFVTASINTAIWKKKEERNCNTITTKIVYELLWKQNWKCAITGLPLILSSKPLYPFCPSVDRIDNEIKEHSVENTHLVCRFVNFGRSHHTVEKYMEAYQQREFRQR